MISKPEKYLDPRLRRLVQTSDDKARLGRDLRRAMVAATNEAALADPAPETTLARVLVMVSSNQPPSGSAPRSPQLTLRFGAAYPQKSPRSGAK